MSYDPTFLSNMHSSVVDALLDQYKADPTSVDASWQDFFASYLLHENGATTVGNGHDTAPLNSDAVAAKIRKEISVRLLIYGYRSRAHYRAWTNPIRQRKDRTAHIDLKYFGLSEADYDQVFLSGEYIGMQNATLRSIVEQLRTQYCEHIGFEYNHIKNPVQRKWVRAKVEDRVAGQYDFTPQKRQRILEKLTHAVKLETFFDNRYRGKKRFSLQGGESIIPGLDALVLKSAELGAQEVVIGMAHRGRLNVLANILGKPYELLIEEMNGFFRDEQEYGNGDVKYHKGFLNEIVTPSGQTVRMKLMPNPSHLEAVNAVVLGYSRARIDEIYQGETKRILPIIVHGDAALAGQGVGYEIAQMALLPPYQTGGTIHLVINNQVGFTTDFDEGRSSDYCTALSAITNSPVFHVNGDDIEAVVFCMEVAAEYRALYQNDVYVDVVCYRKHGHNEGDDPSTTQHKMYELITKHPNSLELYTQQLDNAKVVLQADSDKLADDFYNSLSDKFDSIKANTQATFNFVTENVWQNIKLTKDVTSDDMLAFRPTGITASEFERLIGLLNNEPAGVGVQKKLSTIFGAYRKEVENGTMRWAQGEMLAYAALLCEGIGQRFTGQDIERGTFSHRLATIFDENAPDKNFKFKRLSLFESETAKSRMYNSFLSEYAVLGFEYGYSVALPQILTLWEAQFGDFANGAQIVIDQFISSAESKWLQRSGLVLLLPHGYENMGPEHSSARLERMLQLCSENNMFVVVPSTPANMFHLLRRQVKGEMRKPLVVMTPKSLFGRATCVSAPADFIGDTGFLTVIGDAEVKKSTRVLYCSGKIYYDLLDARAAAKLEKSVALVRIEQLFPLDFAALQAQKAKFPKAEHIWVQEEPANMGALQFLDSRTNRLQFEFDMLLSRKSSATPACGSDSRSKAEQDALLQEALGLV